MNVEQTAMDSSQYFENSGRIRLSRFTLTVFLFNLLSPSESQSTTEHHWQHCNPFAVDNCLSTSGLLDKLFEENTHLKELINRLKTDLQDHAQQLRDLHSDLDNAISRWRDIATTKATYNSLDYTTSTASVSTKSPNLIQPIAVISNTTDVDNMLLHGGRLYSLHSVHSGSEDFSLEIHNALNGKTIGVTYSPRVGYVAPLSVCCKNSQLYIMDVGNNGSYANVSLLESNTNITWQNLNWSPAVNESETIPMSFQISDDCEKVFVSLWGSVLQVRRFSDGGLLVARNLTKKISAIVERDQRYYITFFTQYVFYHNYVTEYDQQLNEVRRFDESRVPSYTGFGFLVYFIAAHEDGGIFISNGGIIYVRPDFMSFVEVVPNIGANGIYYDTELKLLAVTVGFDEIRIYNITRQML